MTFLADIQILDAEREIEFYLRRVTELGQQKIDDAAIQIESLAREILGIGPKATLRRGFALVRDLSGKPVVTAEQAKQAELLNIEFRDGDIKVKPAVNY